MEIQMWKEILNPYELAVEELQVKFNHMVKEYRQAGIYSPIEQVLGRVKSISSILGKAQKQGIDIDQIEGNILDIAGITVNKIAHTVTIDGKEIDLSFKEFELLEYFIYNQGVALSRERILNSVWSYDYFGDARTIDTHVKKLRSKMMDKGNYIKTVWGLGYKFEVE